MAMEENNKQATGLVLAIDGRKQQSGETSAIDEVIFFIIVFCFSFPPTMVTGLVRRSLSRVPSSPAAKLLLSRAHASEPQAQQVEQ
ncbi:hypothetical protein L6452_27386 [Arctium lappa]|uniref:Uncharacterized protein n=1 Tax=Arctium lappa TaxID=4217 RepID=A0ACB8ZW85_ARCLA|nr:hypothetical protein L6452_27386 [Arctium lappa]